MHDVRYQSRSVSMRAVEALQVKAAELARDFLEDKVPVDVLQPGE